MYRSGCSAKGRCVVEILRKSLRIARNRGRGVVDTAEEHFSRQHTSVRQAVSEIRKCIEFDAVCGVVQKPREAVRWQPFDIRVRDMARVLVQVLLSLQWEVRPREDSTEAIGRHVEAFE